MPAPKGRHIPTQGATLRTHSPNPPKVRFLRFLCRFPAAIFRVSLAGLPRVVSEATLHKNYTIVKIPHLYAIIKQKRLPNQPLSSLFLFMRYVLRRE